MIEKILHVLVFIINTVLMTAGCMFFWNFSAIFGTAFSIWALIVIFLYLFHTKDIIS